jgi:type II secretory pathway component GspD/PulD (secretin)
MEVRVYSLKHADSQAVVKTVAREERERKSETLEMAADARTNSIVVKAPREVLNRLDARIRELDVR